MCIRDSFKSGMSKFRSHEAACVVSVVSGEQWPQDRQFQLGLSAEQDCRVRHAAPGAPLRRH
eukprot:2819494-Pyramimonas_sp.AAC.1